MTTALNAAMKTTAAAAIAYRAASKAALKGSGTWQEWENSAERKALKAACTVEVGRVSVNANQCGNTVRQHVRHTFKIDGKRASAAAAAKLFV